MGKKKKPGYWQSRFIDLERATHKEGYRAYKAIEDVFKTAQSEIARELSGWYSRLAKNNKVEIEEAKRLLKANELKEFKWDVKQYIAKAKENLISYEWEKELENASARFHISRLEALLLRIQQYAEVAFGNQLDIIDRVVRKVYTDNYYHTIFELQKGQKIGWKITRLDDKILDRIISKPWAPDGKIFSERIWDNRTKLVNELHRGITRNVLLGDAPHKLIEDISKKFDTTIDNSARLVMTELAFFHTASEKEAFHQSGVEKYEISAVLDTLTSKLCQMFDGRVFALKDMKIGVNAPPLHPNCRSVAVPYFDDNAYGFRAARNMKGDTYYVSAKLSYTDWAMGFIE